MAKIYKLIVTTPHTHAEAVRRALGDAGAGLIGNYSHCSFAVTGTGRYIPLAGANPHIGSVGSYESVEEEQLQVDVVEDKLKAVLEALKKAHPYEEIAYDLYEKAQI